MLRIPLREGCVAVAVGMLTFRGRGREGSGKHGRAAGGMEALKEILDGPTGFAKESVALLKRCAKPDKKEFLQIVQAVSTGFLMMGFIAFFVKLIHIPINNIIVGTHV